MICKFTVGQKVECIDDWFVDPGWQFLELPKHGLIYTIRSVTLFQYADGPFVAILLHEIRNEAEFYNDEEWPVETPFWVGRFRPLSERPTDISELEKLLHPVPASSANAQYQRMIEQDFNKAKEEACHGPHRED